MSSRFYVESSIDSERALLSGQEAQHLTKVMRAKLGDEVILFDGSGAEFSACIVKLGRHEVELQVLAHHDVDRELPFRLIIGVALPKGERQRWLVEKLTELGVTELVPLRTQRGVAQPTGSAIERLRRAVIEASKQCGRNRLLQIDEPRGLEDFFATPLRDARKWLAHPQQVVSPSVFRSAASNPGYVSSDAFLAVGPEGGFTLEEISSATSNGWQLVSLGQSILRTETAAIAMASLFTLSRS